LRRQCDAGRVEIGQAGRRGRTRRKHRHSQKRCCNKTEPATLHASDVRQLSRHVWPNPARNARTLALRVEAGSIKIVIHPNFTVVVKTSIPQDLISSSEPAVHSCLR
jgi:hypothetical protein